MIRCLHKAVLAAALGLLCGVAAASGLEVSPVSLNLTPKENAEGLWLSNIGNGVVHAQVRVYHWTQEGGEEQLTPSRGLVISPPMLELPIGGKQLVRVIRIGPPPAGAAALEDAYRIAVDELPVGTQGRKGLQFVLHYSIPAFVQPAGVAEVAPQLNWSLRRDGSQVTLEVSNAGNGHAQLADLAFTDGSGHRTGISSGLLGYVLPHSTMHWLLKTPAAAFASGGTLEATINGKPATQELSLADRSR